MSTEFTNRLREVINSCCKENGSNTPDFLLADFLVDVLNCWDKTIVAREKWYGREVATIGGMPWKYGDPLAAPAATPEHLDDSQTPMKRE